MKVIVSLLGAGVLVLVVWCFGSAEPLAAVVADNEQENAAQESEPIPLRIFMQQKLGASNTILEGLVTDDMQLVGKGADLLLHMSDAEEWRASNDMLYLQHSRAFHDSVENLKAKAEKHSVDGAALAWMDVTLNCIRCHEWVRNVMIAEGDAADLHLPDSGSLLR